MLDQEQSSSTSEKVSLNKPLADPSLELEIYEKVVFGKLALNSGISAANFYAWWFQLILVGMVLASMSNLEPEFLRTKFGVSETDVGSVEALLLLIDYGFKIFCAPFFGFFIDYFGRKSIFAVCGVLSIVGFMLLPLASTVYTTYLPFKCLISAGMIGMQLLPIQADYIQNTSKGYSAGLTYAIVFIGAGIGASVINICSSWSLEVTYLAIGGIVGVIGVIVMMLMKPGNTYYLNNKKEETVKQSLNEKLTEIKVAIKEIPWIPIGMLCTMLGNADFYIITTGMTLWMQGLTRDGTSSSAASNASLYQMIFYGLSGVSSLLYGLIIQKSNLIKFLVVSMTVSLLGLGFVLLVDGPDSVYLYILFGIEGLSLPGIFLFATFSAARYNPAKHRGALTGIANVIGMVGAVLILVIGGELYDQGIYDAAYLLYAGLLLSCLVGSLCIYAKTKKYLSSLN